MPEEPAMEETRTNRVLEIDMERMDAKQKAVLERTSQGRGRVLTPYKILIHAAEVADGMEVVGTYTNTASSLTAQQRELAIIAVGVFWRSAQVRNAHLVHGRKAGLDEAAIARVLAGDKAVLHDARSQAIHDFTHEMLGGGSMSDHHFAAYEAAIGRKVMAEILGLIGYYTTVSLGMNLHEVNLAGG
jgi:4-carboxymuconolactone decarboxylase